MRDTPITVNTKIPFGLAGHGGFRNKRVRDLTDKQLAWIVEHGNEDPMAAYVPAVKEVIAARAAGDLEMQAEDNLEAQADEYLRNHGFGALCKKGRVMR